jgi:hypothetical protein
MSWQDVMIPMVRVIIGDTASTPTYSNSRLETAIVTAGLIVAGEFTFDTDYTFDFGTPDISPDPTDTDTLDNEAIALFVLKASCIISIGNYQNIVGAGTAGVSVKQGDDSVDTGGVSSSFANLIKLGPCGSYETVMERLAMRRSQRSGVAIMSPFSTESGRGRWGYDGYASWCGVMRSLGF